MTESIYWCQKIERYVKLKNGKCDFDEIYKCSYKNTLLCLLRMLKVSNVEGGSD